MKRPINLWNLPALAKEMRAEADRAEGWEKAHRESDPPSYRADGMLKAEAYALKARRLRNAAAALLENS